MKTCSLFWDDRLLRFNYMVHETLQVLLKAIIFKTFIVRNCKLKSLLSTSDDHIAYYHCVKFPVYIVCVCSTSQFHSFFLTYLVLLLLDSEYLFFFFFYIFLSFLPLLILISFNFLDWNYVIPLNAVILFYFY